MQRARNAIAWLLAGMLVASGAWALAIHRRTATSSKVLTSTAAPPRASVPVPAALIGHQRVWLMTLTVFEHMAANAEAKASLARSAIYVLNREGKVPPPALTSGLDVIPTMNFRNERHLAEAITQKKVPAGIRAILYDNENWSFTPLAQRRDPVSYYEQASELAHSHGYQFVATPGPAGVDPGIAASADVVDIQAQGDQSSPAHYEKFVAPIARAVRAANPDAVIVSGLSTNHGRVLPTPRELVSIADSVSSDVSGYWLNIPPPGPGRPSLPQYQIGLRFLEVLGQAAGATGPTTIVQYDPWSATGALAGNLSVAATADGSCFAASLTLGAPNAFRCMTAHGKKYDPCFVSPTHKTEVACVAAPWSTSVEILHLSAGLPPPNPVPANPETYPWALTLANGEHCLATTGSIRVVAGVDLSYACISSGGAIPTVSSGAQTSTPSETYVFWTVELAASPSARKLSPIDVSEAWV